MFVCSGAMLTVPGVRAQGFMFRLHRLLLRWKGILDGVSGPGL